MKLVKYIRNFKRLKRRFRLLVIIIIVVVVYYVFNKKLYIPQVAINDVNSMTGELVNDSAFNAKVNQVADDLGIQANWLLACMYLESSLNPSARNSASGATGLIQFMPATAISLGTTVDALYSMDAVTQMDYVEAYLKPYASKMVSFVDVYLSIFYPAAVGQAPDYIIGAAGGAVASENAAYQDADGNVTPASIEAVITERVNNANFNVS